MRYSIIILLFLTVAGAYSCKKYKDPAPITDPRLTNPYCNDPDAVNYNWGFPGKVDPTVCFYPTDIFAGVYELNDSVFFDSSNLFIFADTITLTIYKQTNTKLGVMGFCTSGNLLQMTAGPNFTATVDTTVGDTTTTMLGQTICGRLDTINGTFTKDRINDSIIYIALHVSSDTGKITNHIGRAKLLYKK